MSGPADDRTNPGAAGGRGADDPAAPADAPAPDDAWRPLARRAAAWATGVALTIVVAAVLVALSWRDELPDPVASHWSSGDRPDGFMSLGADLTTMAVASTALAALFGGFLLAQGRETWARRLLASTAVWIVGVVCVLVVGSLWHQRGLDDGAQAPLPGAALALALVGPAVLALPLALLLPADPPAPASGPVAADAPRVALGPGQPPVWTQRVVSRAVLAVGGVVVAGSAAAVAAGRLWPMLAVPVLVAALLGATAVVHVRIDGDGLTVRSPLGWPRSRVPAAEVVRAGVDDVSPLADFGGWGWRLGRGGRTGVVLRGGEAVVVERTGGRGLVVTVDDAGTAAALLNTVADRARGA